MSVGGRMYLSSTYGARYICPGPSRPFPSIYERHVSTALWCSDLFGFCCAPYRRRKCQCINLKKTGDAPPSQAGLLLPSLQLTSRAATIHGFAPSLPSDLYDPGQSQHNGENEIWGKCAVCTVLYFVWVAFSRKVSEGSLFWVYGVMANSGEGGEEPLDFHDCGGGGRGGGGDGEEFQREEEDGAAISKLRHRGRGRKTTLSTSPPPTVDGEIVLNVFNGGGDRAVASAVIASPRPGTNNKRGSISLSFLCPRTYVYFSTSSFSALQFSYLAMRVTKGGREMGSKTARSKGE